jgi:hypothetical protein
MSGEVNYSFSSSFSSTLMVKLVFNREERFDIFLKNLFWYKNGFGFKTRLIQPLLLEPFIYSEISSILADFILVIIVYQT